jgi:CubicO group peptidase (beta-lactamase class C family)
MSIERVENGLMSAVCITGEPLEKKNLLAQMKELNVPGVSIAVINEGKIEWAKAYGVLSSAQEDLVNTDTLFQAGSVSKPVAAFAILSLVQQGLINLDDDVNEKLTSWKVPENEYTTQKKITLRHLLSHTSGFNVIGFDGYRYNESVPTIFEILEGISPANNAPIRVEFTPFSKMNYSGGGYCVVQQLVEDVTKQPFSEWMQQVLLDPLKMTNSTFIPRANSASAHPAQGIPMEGGWKTYPELAAAGLWSTPTDLAKYLIAIQNGSFLKKDLLNDMLTPQLVVHGLGPVVNGEGMELEVSHKGRTDGFACGFVSFPHLKKGAVVMVNASTSLVDDILRSIANVYNWPTYKVKTRETVEVSESILEKYCGRYGFNETPNDIYDVFVYLKENKLFFKIGDWGKESRLYPEKNNQFFLLESGYDVVFNEGEATFIVQPGFERKFKKF